MCRKRPHRKPSQAFFRTTEWCCRAGREAAGKAFRLYTEAAFLGLEAASAPEIQRVSLASLVLQLKQLGVADVLAFPFMDAPPKAALLRALELLLTLGALDADGALSQPLGAQLVRLPLEPAFGKVRACTQWDAYFPRGMFNPA